MKYSCLTLMTLPLVSGFTTRALADGAQEGYYGHMGMMGGGWFMGPIMMLIFFAFLVGAVVLIVRLLGGGFGSSKGAGTDRALHVLRERFANGEINEEEFQKRKRVLEA